jgi:NAD-dependent deacetylase
MDRLAQEGQGRFSFFRAYQRHGFRCARCQRMTRPDIVFFGERLPEQVYERAMALAEVSRVLLVIGTSTVVRPASDIPYAARQAGARLVEINPEPSDLTSFVDLHLPGRSGDILPRIVDALA